MDTGRVRERERERDRERERERGTVGLGASILDAPTLEVKWQI